MREWDYQVTALLRAVDGDTYDLTVHKEMDFGFYQREDKYWSARFRLLGIDTPEVREAGGTGATTFASNWIWWGIRDGTLRGQTFKTDNFGRWLIDLYRIDAGVETHLADALRAAGYEKRIA